MQHQFEQLPNLGISDREANMAYALLSSRYKTARPENTHALANNDPFGYFDLIRVAKHLAKLKVQRNNGSVKPRLYCSEKINIKGVNISEIKHLDERTLESILEGPHKLPGSAILTELPIKRDAETSKVRPVLIYGWKDDRFLTYDSARNPYFKSSYKKTNILQRFELLAKYDKSPMLLVLD